MARLKKHPQERGKRKGMVPADEKAKALIDQLLHTGKYNVKEVVRIIEKQGYEVSRTFVYRRRSKLNLRPVGMHKKDRTIEKRDLKWSKLKTTLSAFKKLPLESKLDILDNLIKTRDSLENSLGSSRMKEARKILLAKVRDVNSLLRVFSKYVEKEEALKERGLDFR